MPRVLHLIGNFEEDKGGAQRVVLDIINSCSGSGIEMGVCSLFGNATLSKRLATDTFNVNFQYSFKYSPKLFFDIYSLVAKWEPDILHIHSSVAGFFGRPIAALLDIRQITTVHNDVIDAPLKNKFADKLLIGLSDHIICVSGMVKESVKKLFGGHIKPDTDIVEISNCLDCDRLARNVKVNSYDKKKLLGLDDKRFIVGTVGRLHPVKGHIYLLEAWESVIKQFPESVLLIVGDGRERKRLEKLTQEMDIEESVLFLGARDDVVEILNIMDVFVLPSLSEGLPISLLEAMCMKKVIISSDIRSVKEVLGDTGILVPPENSNTLGQHISDVLNNFGEKVYLGEKAGERVVKNFNPKEFGRQYLDIYRKYLQ